MMTMMIRHIARYQSRAPRLEKNILSVSCSSGAEKKKKRMENSIDLWIEFWDANSCAFYVNGNMEILLLETIFFQSLLICFHQRKNDKGNIVEQRTKWGKTCTEPLSVLQGNITVIAFFVANYILLCVLGALSFGRKVERRRSRQQQDHHCHQARKRGIEFFLESLLDGLW